MQYLLTCCTENHKQEKHRENKGGGIASDRKEIWCGFVCVTESEKERERGEILIMYLRSVLLVSIKAKKNMSESHIYCVYTNKYAVSFDLLLAALN